MQRHALTSAVLAGTLCLLQVGVGAQPAAQRGNDNGNSYNRRSEHSGNHYSNARRPCRPADPRCDSPREIGRDEGRGMDRDGGRDGNPYGPGARGRFDGERGAGPGHAFYRGDRLPLDYRSRRYVVDDWRGHGLRSPPRGYHWVQTGGDYVLVAIATGVILELLLNR